MGHLRKEQDHVLSGNSRGAYVVGNYRGKLKYWLSVLGQKHLFEQQLSRDVRCVVTVETITWKRDGPALIHIRMENLTDRDLDLETIPTLYLKNYENEYWSPTDIVASRALDTRQQRLGKGTLESIELIPPKLHLEEQDSSMFRVDATQTKWDREISSSWHGVSLRTLPRGLYFLRLELSDQRKNLIKSNEVKVWLAE
ncbi:MAG TPA: hypothetical protein VLL05_09675 [Terriglobales bacterium]|nr:hypothetical protein [Terriglobales bacterium]